MAEPIVHYSGPLVSCSDAFERGAKRYFTGNPCKRGHIAQRLVSNSQCAVCLAIKDKARKSSPEYRAKQRAKYADNPELRKKNYGHVKEWRKTHSRTEEKRRWVARHPELAEEINLRYRQNNREVLVERVRRWERANPDLVKASRVRARHRLEEKYVQEAGRPRPSKCDICKGNRGGIVFDHCHKEGHFRGWICNWCNTALGLAKDSPALLKRMARYLEDNSGETIDQSQEETPLFQLRLTG